MLELAALQDAPAALLNLQQSVVVLRPELRWGATKVEAWVAVTLRKNELADLAACIRVVEECGLTA